MHVANKIRSALDGLAITHADNPLGIVSVSGGISSATVALGGAVDPKALLERADALLYAAKLAGRNRFFADEE